MTLDSLTKCLSDLQEGLAFVTKMVAHASDGSAMEGFLLAADIILVDLSKQLDTGKEATFELFTYFGEDQTKSLNEFFGTLSRFIAMFESARAQVRRKQELNVRWL
jgi:hypothetical protein